MKGKFGRKSVDGAVEVTTRVNVVMTQEHKRRLELLATHGFSAWMRAAIDAEWNKRTKANQ